MADADTEAHERLIAAVERLEERLSALEARTKGGPGTLGDAAQKSLDSTVDAISGYVEANPVRATLLAFFLGLVIGARR
jgi:ElaB/YqjD/DUF883 family membrane-anchored ribosome-binding protein